MSATLWTPDGNVGLAQKDVIGIPGREIAALMVLSDMAAKYGLTLVCEKCDHSILGQNNGQERHPSVACTCREFRYDGPDPRSART